MEDRSKIYRATFSLSLAELIKKSVEDKDIDIKRRRYKVGKKLARGEPSKALYGIMSAHKPDLMLRCEMTAAHAAAHAPDEHRFIAEVYLSN